MSTIARGIVAGLGVIIVVSVIMAPLGWLPRMHVIAMSASLFCGAPIVGWIAHFKLGTPIWEAMSGPTFASL